MSPARIPDWPMSGWRRAAVLGLLLLAALQLGTAAMIKAKAWLAPLLIARAWEHSLAAGGAPVKPWPWADTWPVAWLSVPARAIELPVLAGDSGNVLAFAPGHASASAPLGSAGEAVIGGHRDTHFAFLEGLPANTRLQLQLPSGELRHYRLADQHIIDASLQDLDASSAGESLLLVTCYPFNSLQSGGPLRYVVRAVPERPIPGFADKHDNTATGAGSGPKLLL